MAVVVVDNRILVNEADSTTGWTGSVSPSVFTSGPNPKELTGNLGWSTSQSEEYVYHTITSTDLSNTLIYIWTLVLGTEQTLANGGRQVFLGDGTHARGYYVGGSDTAGFRHDTGEVNWQCFILDTANLPASFTQHLGSTAPTLTAITQVGVGYVVDSKALGGGSNTYVDIPFYGNAGLSIVGGTTGARGTFSEIADIDARNTNYGGTEDSSGARSSGTAGSSYGIIRELSSGVFGLSGSLTFGNSTETADSYFDDDGVVVVFENRISSLYWYFDAEGNATNNVTFNLSNSTIKSAGPTVTCDFTGGNINTLTFDTVSFVDLLGDIDFSNSADATGHSVTNCTFQNCGEIDPGDVTFQNNTISDSADSVTGAVLLDADGVSNWSGLDFISGGTGHAIYITATGSYTFTNFTYSGYGLTGTTDAVIYNDSGGSVTINVSGGDTPTYRNGAGASTTIVSSVSVDVHVEDLGGVAIEDAQVFIRKAGTYYPYTSHATNNTAGAGTFEVNETIDADLPQTGWIHVWDSSTNTKQEYRYASWTGLIFTLRTEVTGSATSTGSSTSLISTSTNFTTADIEEGDTIRNTTDGSWAVVDEIVDADNITTTELQGGADNTWTSSDAFSLHRLAITYDSTDLADVPLFNGQTDASGDISTTFGGTTPASISVRIRSNEGSTKYVPYSTSGTITSSGYSLTAVMTEDTVAT